jgi:hypothetical protein
MSRPNRNWTEEEWLVYENRFLRVMRRHVGKSRAISATRLYEEVFLEPPKDAITGTRALRNIIKKLENDGEIICSSTSSEGGGYFSPSCESEIKEHFRKRDRRIMEIARISAKQKRVALPDYLNQLSLDLRGSA